MARHRVHRKVSKEEVVLPNTFRVPMVTGISDDGNILTIEIVTHEQWRDPNFLLKVRWNVDIGKVVTDVLNRDKDSVEDGNRGQSG